MTIVPGKVYFLGLMPGDPNLLTARASKVLSDADLIIHGEGIEERSRDIFPTSAEVLFTGRDGGRMPLGTEDIVAEMSRSSTRGRRVVRVFAGDPYFDGEAGAEMVICQAQGLRFEVIPAIPLSMAACAYAGIPVLQRGVSRSVLFVWTPSWTEELGRRSEPIPVTSAMLPPVEVPLPPTRKPGVVIRKKNAPGEGEYSLRPSSAAVPVGAVPMKVPGKPVMLQNVATPLPAASAKDPVGGPIDWRSLCRAADTLVFQQAGDYIAPLRAGLLEGGRTDSEPVAVIVEGGTASQRTMLSTVGGMVETFSRSRIPDSALLVVGDVVNLRGLLNFRDAKALQGMRIVLLEDNPLLRRAKQALEAAGCRVRLLPVIGSDELTGLPDLLADFRDDLRALHYIVVEDEVSAGFFLEGLQTAGLDVRVLPEYCELMAIGVGAALRFRSAGLQSQLIDASGGLNAVLAQLPESLKDRRMLVVGSSSPKTELLRELRARGATATHLPVFDREPHDDAISELVESLRDGDLELIVFHSEEMIDTLERRWTLPEFRRRLEGVLVAAIGTGATARLVRDHVPCHVTSGNILRLADSLESMEGTRKS
jgi:siroheme synthase/uroporphyrinogen-III synthase